MKCLRCGLEITKWHPATPDVVDVHANRGDCIVELRAEVERLRRVINILAAIGDDEWIGDADAGRRMARIAREELAALNAAGGAE